MNEELIEQAKADDELNWLDRLGRSFGDDDIVDIQNRELVDRFEFYFYMLQAVGTLDSYMDASRSRDEDDRYSYAPDVSEVEATLLEGLEQSLSTTVTILSALTKELEAEELDDDD